MNTLRTIHRVAPVFTTATFVKPQPAAYLNPAFALGIRGYASKHRVTEGKQILVRDYGVIANYVPPETTPAISDFHKWRLVKWRNLRNSVQNMLGIGLIKYKSLYEKWNSGKFLSIAEETYKDMNSAFARGDRNLLEEVCLDAMYSNLKNQLKTRSNVTWDWQYHGEVEAPKIVCVRCMGTSGFSKTGFSVGQVTVRMHTKQSMAVYDKKNRLIAGDPHKIQNVREYVVFQRALTDPEDVWKVYGKVAPTEQKF
ncbi:hypothetical protein BGW37DRAFT_432020 [Umbelopsis sp. PMI_123]|nr:hypothetical protein BGW37DRAFT_432020 [Umbelopsis sp. PMI_123]